MAKPQNLIALFLAICLLVSASVIYRLASYHELNRETVVFTEGPDEQYARQVLRCAVTSRVSDLDIRDYSYNVTQSLRPAGLFRYMSNLEARPPVDVHVLVIQGGSGRVVLENTEQPAWLVLLSSQAALWHVQLAPGANLEKVIVNDSVSEIRFSGALTASPQSLKTLLFDSRVQPVEVPSVEVLPDSMCMVRLTRFQEYEDLRRFVPSITSLRNAIGHPELSLQAAGQPSYFDRPFHVPFEVPRVSPQRLTGVMRLADPPRVEQSDSQSVLSPREAFASELERYANMPRDENTVAKTLSSPAEFLSLLAEYQRRNLLPSLFPVSSPGSQGLDSAGWFSLADYQNAYRRQVPAGETPDACNGGRDNSPLIIEGTNDTNIVGCAWGNQLYFLRDGNDEVDDSWEDDIVNAGPGDDLIDVGWGNDLVFFNYGWGQDTVRKTCTGSAYVPQDTPNSSQVDWSAQWPYKNFLVFGKDIRLDDIVVAGNKLVHRETGDSVTIDGNCFNMVFWQ